MVRGLEFEVATLGRSQDVCEGVQFSNSYPWSPPPPEAGPAKTRSSQSCEVERQRDRPKSSKPSTPNLSSYNLSLPGT